MCSVKSRICLFFTLSIMTFFIATVIISQSKENIHQSISIGQYSPIIHYFDSQNESAAFLVTELTSTDTKSEPSLVLIWDELWGANEVMINETLYTLFNGCSPDLNCMVTENRSLLEESAAVVFRLRFFRWHQLPENLTRRSDQYFVMAEWESPDHEQYLDMSGHDGFFNLTMTYRRDSDIVWPFGYVLPIPENQKRKNDTELIQLAKLVQGKTKLVAWFASNCHNAGSNRVKFVADLRKYLKVDTYGKCGELVCPKREGLWISSQACYDMLTRDYKFYLSLENTICIDYVSEKFFDMVSTVTIIPVVFERQLVLNTIEDKEIARVFNRSFVALDDFDSVEDLANYLIYLDKNMTAYMEYFEWKSNYQIVLDRTAKLPGCELCRIVKEKKKCVFPDINNWWYEGGKCKGYE